VGIPADHGTLWPIKARRITKPWYAPWRSGKQPETEALTAAATDALTSAATIVAAPRGPLMKTDESWQREAWEFFDQLGEFNTGVTWLSQMMSRVRFRAALLKPDLDEPSISDVQPADLAATLMRDLAGGVGGQAQMIRGLVTQLSVPGEGYLVGEQLTQKSFSWMVRSNEEVRATSGHFEVVGDRIPTVRWVPLPENSLVVRVWRPHPRYYHIADSPARSARPIMRELELVNRHITAEYLSRLAMAGLLILPEEASFPVREEFQDEPDALSLEFVEIAAESIKEPGHASAIVPLLIRVPSEVADKIKHIDFTLQIEEKIIERRNSAIERLANKLDIPAEIMTGRGAVNHWTAWNLDEAALKTHIAPMAELISHCLTVGYLQPRLAASGETDIGKWVVWYDMSELAIRPDRSENAVLAYDRGEIDGEALRRETGFDEDDTPEGDVLTTQLLKTILRTQTNPAMVGEAFEALTHAGIFTAPLAPEAPTGGPPGVPQDGQNPPQEEPGTTGEQNGPPNAGKAPDGPPAKNPAKPPAKTAAQLEHALKQAQTMHAVRFSGTRGPVLMHPPLCAENAYGCPFTHAGEEALITQLSTGSYEAKLDAFGRLLVGNGVPWLDTSGWITTETKILGQRSRKVVTHG